MGINWDNYPHEKKLIKLKYLELLKRRFEGKSFHLRDELTNWALQEFPHIKAPKAQFAGSFGHSRGGIFVIDHGFAVTEKAIEYEAFKRNISAIQYIESLIAIVEKNNNLNP